MDGNSKIMTTYLKTTGQKTQVHGASELLQLAHFFKWKIKFGLPTCSYTSSWSFHVKKCQGSPIFCFLGKLATRSRKELRVSHVWWDFPLVMRLSWDLLESVAILLKSLHVQQTFMQFTMITVKSIFLLQWLHSKKKQKTSHLQNSACKTRWWFQIFFIFTSTWGRFPILTSIFFRWVGSTTNQKISWDSTTL